MSIDKMGERTATYITKGNQLIQRLKNSKTNPPPTKRAKDNIQVTKRRKVKSPQIHKQNLSGFAQLVLQQISIISCAPEEVNFRGGYKLMLRNCPSLELKLPITRKNHEFLFLPSEWSTSVSSYVKRNILCPVVL